jgi:hypothetical protein
MEKISEVITRKAEEVLEELFKIQNGEITEDQALVTRELVTKSQAAIFGGRNSDEWRAYMNLFVGNDPDNIDRLVPPAAAPDPEPGREKARAYLVRNGMCSEGTTPTILHTIETTLD